MNFKNFLFLGIVTCSYFYTFGMEDSSLPVEVQVSMEKSSLPVEIQTILNEHAEELQILLKEYNDKSSARMGMNVRIKSWLPGYLIKYGVERVANAQRLKDTIDENKLDLLSVAEKYLYHVPGMPSDLSSKNYLVIAKRVDGNNGKGQAVNFKQAKQLLKLALCAKHYDLHPANYITAEGKITVIDTDKYAMPPMEVVERLRNDWLKNGNRIHDGHGVRMNPEIINDPLIKLELSMYSKWNNYDEDTYEYLYKKIEEHEQHRLELKKFIDNK